MSEIELGNWTAGGAAQLNVERLVETRMLVQANSGGGKSWALRRLLEQTAGHVQQLIVDPEGEFATLREKHDLVIAAAHDGDALAHPKTAKILAERLLETGVSAVLDIYDLKAHERMAFVRGFIDSLVNAPKALWRPVLVVLDEAHIFAPEHGKAESVGSVIDLATRGRKRGFALIAATQRLAKLHKDVAAELLNKLIGRTGLDVDVKRAADELGISPKEALQVLRPLAPGHFYAFGPAINPQQPAALTIGPVRTTHPKVGDRQLRVPPKPTAAIVAVLPKLADLPKEAEQRERTVDDLRKDLANARRELTSLKRAPDMKSAAESELRAALARQEREASATETRLQGDVRAAEIRLARLLTSLHAIVSDLEKPLTKSVVPVPTIQRVVRPTPEPVRVTTDGVTKPQQKLLDALAWLEHKGIHPAPRNTLAAVAGVSPTSGGYFNNLGAMRAAGLIDYPTPGMVGFHDAGRSAARFEDDGRAVHECWLSIVTEPQAKILRALLEHHPDPVEKGDLARQIGVSETSGGYFNNLGALRTLGAIDYPQKGFAALTEYVMP